MRAFLGFNTDPLRLTHLQTLVTCLSCLQQTVQHQEFQKLRNSVEQARRIQGVACSKRRM